MSSKAGRRRPNSSRGTRKPTRTSGTRSGIKEARPAQPSYSDEGVDLTLIRWMPSLTPAERLEVLQQNVQSLLRLRDNKPKAVIAILQQTLKEKSSA
ncbi:MAG: hypothetical protein LAO21_18695 [Acidobacteriia bacterium]|nr:hypothetical protein [Terriglobia bacterium]